MSALKPLWALAVLLLVASCDVPTDTASSTEDTATDCVLDCAGTCNGDAVVDECGTCDDDPGNDCVQDCAGEWGGPAELDECGTCDDDPGNDCDPRPVEWTSLPAPEEVETGGITCDQHDWLQKYMRYRRRLRGDGTADYPGFLSVGPDPGQSIPAGERYLDLNCHTDWRLGGCDLEDQPDTHGMYSWGDGTIWLGEYLEVLASEWAVFTDLGLDTTQTERDLMYALHAFDRLDLAAEVALGYPAERNGFYLRDDVPPDFVDGPDGPRFPRDDMDPMGNDVVGYECVSASSSCGAPRLDDGDYTSQDQTVALVHGMVLTAALIPDSLVVDGMPIRETAREAIDRMVWHLREDNWHALDPAGNEPPALWGGDLVGFSYTLAEAADQVCGEDFRNLGLLGSYQNTRSRTLGWAAFEGLPAIWQTTFSFNRNMGLRAAAYTGLWDARRVADLAVYDGKDYWAMTWAIIQDEEIPEPFSPWRIESWLDAAPCGGPCRDYEHCEDAPGWRGQSRNTSPDDRAGNKYHMRGEFNGLDYMALHNLYYLYRKGDFGRSVANEAPENCEHFTTLDDLRSVGVPGDVYDTTDRCVTEDAERRFCGRTFGSWLAAAERGDAVIVTGGHRWECTEDGCAITSDAGAIGSWDELVLGTDGPDTLEGGLGNDCLIGFGGDDLILGGDGYDEIHGGEGDDELHGEEADTILSGQMDEIYGGPGDDLLTGGGGKDGLYGGPGDDVLYGRAQDDVMEGGPGNDAMYGELGSDFLSGDAGDDLMIGGMGDDHLTGEEGHDRIDGNGGDDGLNGGLGRDFLRGGNGDDVLVGGDQDGYADRSCGGDGADVIWGGWQGDECRGHDEDDNAATDGDEVHCSHPDIEREACGDDAFDAWAP